MRVFAVLKYKKLPQVKAVSGIPCHTAPAYKRTARPSRRLCLTKHNGRNNAHVANQLNAHLEPPAEPQGDFRCDAATYECGGVQAEFK